MIHAQPNTFCKNDDFPLVSHLTFCNKNVNNSKIAVNIRQRRNCQSVSALLYRLDRSHGSEVVRFCPIHQPLQSPKLSLPLVHTLMLPTNRKSMT